jgi:hypothetical protein
MLEMPGKPLAMNEQCRSTREAMRSTNDKAIGVGHPSLSELDHGTTGPRYQTWNHRVHCLPWWASILLCSCSSSLFLSMPLPLPFELGIFTLCYFIWEVCNLFFDFYRGSQLRVYLESQRRL